MKNFSFTKRYILALSIIAILSTLAYFNMNHLISSQYSSGNIINISGKQRMLSQQISLHAIYYKTKTLKENIKLMEKNHNYLISMPMNQELKDLYFGNKISIDKNKKDYINEISKRVKSDYIQEPIMLDKKVRAYLEQAKNFLETRSGNSLTYLLTNSKPLLQDLDKATSLYVKEAQKNTKLLIKVELYIFILTLLTLLFEALFIFRPANKKIVNDKIIITKEKEYSNTVIESSTNAIITLDRELKIITFNKKAQEIFGYTKNELKNTISLQKIIPTLKEKNIQQLLKRIEDDNIYTTQELMGLNKSSKEFPIRISFGISKEENSLLIVANIQNIEQEKLKDKIVQHQAKFAALGEMIAIIAHQWRQPLSQLNFNNLYIKKITTNKDIINEIKNNEDIISFMSETIKNFEDFYKKSDNQEFNPAKSVEQALKIVDSIIKLKEINLNKEFFAKSNIYGNPNALAQVVLSILQNSLDVIKSRNIENPSISITTKEDANTLYITILDNAGGIKNEHIDTIFQPFKSTKTVASTGIGLYMSRLVINEKFKGTIEANNSQFGALFTIKIPL
jgi:PAS domain S-box-containing protein